MKIHLSNKNNNLEQLQISNLATLLDGFTGADIQKLVNEVANDLAFTQESETECPIITFEMMKLKVEDSINEKNKLNRDDNKMPAGPMNFRMPGLNNMYNLSNKH